MRIFGEVDRHFEVVANLVGQAGLEIALRESFEEGFELCDVVGNEGGDAVEDGRVVLDVVADLIDAAVEEVGSADVELPEVFGLPRGERVGS